jgi:hypothetical protein
LSSSYNIEIAFEIPQKRLAIGRSAAERHAKADRGVHARSTA